MGLVGVVGTVIITVGRAVVVRVIRRKTGRGQNRGDEDSTDLSAWKGIRGTHSGPARRRDQAFSRGTRTQCKALFGDLRPTAAPGVRTRAPRNRGRDAHVAGGDVHVQCDRKWRSALDCRRRQGHDGCALINVFEGGSREVFVGRNSVAVSHAQSRACGGCDSRLVKIPVLEAGGETVVRNDIVTDDSYQSLTTVSDRQDSRVVGFGVFIANHEDQ